MKETLAEHAVATALVAGVLVFVLADYAIGSVGGWPPIYALGAAAVAFLATVLGAYALVHNVVDPYTLQAAAKEDVVDGLIHDIQRHVGEVKDPAVRATLANICRHSADLISRTRKSQPNNLLSGLTVLENWLRLVDDPGIRQYVDVQNQPEYHIGATDRLKKAQDAFQSFDAFLLESIRTIEAGNNVEFDAATRMLDSTRFSIAERRPS